MQKNKLLVAALGALFALPALAADTPPYTITSNVSLVSNYLYRGISQTGDKAAIQGGFDYAHASGFYAGAWGSSISWLVDGAYYNSSSLELDTYAGFKGSIAADVSYDVGFLRYNYPGEYTAPQITANTNELYGAVGYKWVTAKYSRSLTNLFGTADSSGSSYIELNGSYTLEEPGVTLGAHYGKQTVSGAANSGWTYSDYNVKASKDFSGYTLGLMFSKLKGSTSGIYSDKAEKMKTVLSLARSF